VPSAGERLKWIKTSLGDKLRLVAIEEICYFQSADKYTSVYTRDAQLLIRTPLKDLIKKLDPEQFWQIHRGTVVNARQVLVVSTDADGHVTLKLRDRPEVLPVSRSYAHLFKQM